MGVTKQLILLSAVSLTGDPKRNVCAFCIILSLKNNVIGLKISCLVCHCTKGSISFQRTRIGPLNEQKSAHPHSAHSQNTKTLRPAQPAMDLLPFSQFWSRTQSAHSGRTQGANAGLIQYTQVEHKVHEVIEYKVSTQVEHMTRRRSNTTCVVRRALDLPTFWPFRSISASDQICFLLQGQVVTHACKMTIREARRRFVFFSTFPFTAFQAMASVGMHKDNLETCPANPGRKDCFFAVNVECPCVQTWIFIVRSSCPCCRVAALNK